MRIHRIMLAAVGLLMFVLALVVAVIIAQYEPNRWTSDGTFAFIDMGKVFAPVLAAIGVAIAGSTIAMGPTNTDMGRHPTIADPIADAQRRLRRDIEKEEST